MVTLNLVQQFSPVYIVLLLAIYRCTISERRDEITIYYILN